jgi:hypothetical protein
MYDLAYADAEAVGGAIVNYTIPRKVTIPTDDSRTRSQRVASFDLKPEFTHVVNQPCGNFVGLCNDRLCRNESRTHKTCNRVDQHIQGLRVSYHEVCSVLLFADYATALPGIYRPAISGGNQVK